MDAQQIKKINQAAEKFAEAVGESYRSSAEQSIDAQHQSMELAQSFFERVIVELDRQAKSGSEVSGDLMEASRKQAEANAQLTQRSIEAYRHFLSSMRSPRKGEEDG
jgi:CHAD domain-containing protein